jgi:hypothetical protein
MTDAPDLGICDQRIAHIRECALRDRWAAAGFGLIELRQWYEASPATAFPDDERTWPDFAAKRLPSIDVGRLIGQVQFRGGTLQCSGCGALAVCHCGCGTPYLVDHPWGAPAPPPAPKLSAFDRAIAAILAAPEKSNRAIAAEIGVSNQTVMRARQRMTTAGPDGAVMEHPDQDTNQREVAR